MTRPDKAVSESSLRTSSRPPSSDSLRRRTVVSVALCVLALAAGASVFSYLASLKKPPEAVELAERVYNVEVFNAEGSTLQEILSGFGTARSNREVVVAAQVTGEIVEVHPILKVGHEAIAPQVVVSESGESDRLSGDLLVRIDPKTYRERLAQAQHRLAEDEAELNRIRQEEENNARMVAKVTKDYETFKEEYERMESLRERGTATRSQLARAFLELQRYEESLIQNQNEKKLFPLRYDLLRKRQQTHRADLQLARLDLERTEVRPPFTGRLSEVMVELGQFVRPGEPIVRLTDVTAVEVPVPLTLREFAKIESQVKTGRNPRVVLAENETAPPRWTGSVVRVAPEADEQTRTINVYVYVDNQDQEVSLLPGTFVHARIDGPQLRDVVVVPRDALSNGQVYVARNGKVQSRKITIGQTLQSLAVIEQGVKSGDRVVMTNLDVIHDGARVSIQSHRSLADELENQRTKVARQTLAGGGSDRGEGVH